MESVLTLAGLQLPLRAGAAAASPDGVLLSGAEVAVLHPFGATRFYRHGWQSWSETRWVDLRRRPQPIQPPARRAQADDPLYARAPGHGGSALGALEGPDATILLLGALAPGARVEADATTLRGFYESGPGDWLLAVGPEPAVFARYAERLGAVLGRRGQAPAPRVWCSWYSHYTRISEPLLQDVLAGLGGLPFDVFQVDDGWQADVGDWEPNAKFPGGMAALAARIQAAGLTAGLWLAPFLVRPTARLGREHPDWLLRDAGGRPVAAGHNWDTPLAALDTTHPDVQAWLDALIARVLAWGYRYLKLDFLYTGALPGVRHEPLPREEAYRQALARIRAAAGDAYLLVCGAPVVASLGLADGLRIGPDVAPFWDDRVRRRELHDPTGPATLNAIRTALHRLWLRPLIHTDPDVVFFRTRYNLLLPEQALALQRLAEIAGFKANSDPPGWLDPQERAALAAFLAASPGVEPLGRYAFRVGGELVDYAAIAAADEGASDEQAFGEELSGEESSGEESSG